MAAHQAPPSLGFSRQEHWSGLPFPSPMHESGKWKWSHSVVSDSSDPMDWSPSGSSIHGIFQERVLEWGAIAFSRYTHTVGYYLDFEKNNLATYSTDIKQGPLGLLGTKTFCVPHFFDYRKQPSFSLHDCPWVTKGRFKQLLIRKGRGWKIKEKQSWAALGQGSVFPIKGYTQQYLWTILQILKPPQVKEDNN